MILPVVPAPSSPPLRRSQHQPKKRSQLLIREHEPNNDEPFCTQGFTSGVESSASSSKMAPSWVGGASGWVGSWCGHGHGFEVRLQASCRPSRFRQNCHFIVERRARMSGVSCAAELFHLGRQQVCTTSWATAFLQAAGCALGFVDQLFR